MKFNFEKAKEVVKKGVLPAAALIMGGTAMGQNGPSSGNELARNDKVAPIKSSEGGVASVDLTKAKFSNSQPAGTTSYGKVGNREYFIRTTDGGNKAEAIKKAAVSHKSFHYSSSVKKAFHKNTTPSQEIKKITPPGVELFYIENAPQAIEKEVDPFAKYAVTGNPVYHNGVSGPNTGQMYYTSMQSKNIQEAGMANTGDEDFVIRLEDGNGKPILKDSNGNLVPGGLAIKIKAGDRNKYLEVSGHLKPGAYEAIMKQIEDQIKLNKEDKKEVQNVGQDFTVKTNTVGLPGSNIDGTK